MASSFVETATLKVVDESSAKIKLINSELKKLNDTAKGLKGSKADLGINASKLAAAEKEVRKLLSDFKQLQSAKANLTVNTSGITQASSQIRKLRAEASRPITLKTLAATAAAYGVTQKAWEATKRGTRQADLGKTGLDQLQLGERRKYANEQIAETEKRLRALAGPYQFNTGLVAQRYAENLREEREGEAAKALRVPLGEEFSAEGKYKRPQDIGDESRSRAATAAESRAASEHRMRVASERTYQEIVTADQIAKDTGVSAESALEKIKGFYRALDQTGMLQNEAGMNTVENLQKAGDFIRTMRGAIGEEATGEFFQHMVRREKAAKFALSKKGQLAVAFVAEDMGAPSAGTAFSTWQNQVQGARITNMAREAQQKAGLAEHGKWVGKGMAKKFVADTVDSELAQTDPLAYARKRLVPAMQKMGMTEQEIFAGTPETIAKMSNNMRKLYSDTNAANFAITVMSHLLELESKTRDAYTRDTSPEAMAEATKNSVQASTNAVQSSFEGLAGQMVVAFAPAISKTADLLSTGIGAAAADIKLAGDATQDTQTRVAAGARAAGMIGMVAAPGLIGIRALTGALDASGATGAIARTGGMRALLSKNEGMQALGGAGLSLMAAADALKGAASALALTAAAGKEAGWLRQMADTAYKFGGVEGKAAFAILDFAARMGEIEEQVKAGTLPEYKAKLEREAAAQDLERRQRLGTQAGVAEGDLGTAQKNLDVISKALEEEVKTGYGPRARQLAQLKAIAEKEVADRKAAADKLKAASETPAVPEVKPPTAAEEATKKEAEAKAAKAKADAEERAAQARKDAVKAEEEAKPLTGPAALAADAGARTAAGTAPGVAAEANVETAANTFQSAVTALSGQSSLFATAFSTGAQQIGAAGQTAADTIKAGASSAGSAYGAAAAAAIAAATANINVNVSVKGGSADTGNSKAAAGPGGG